jgi:hypothetical protein
VLPTSAAAKYRRGSENENIVNIEENIGKYRKMSQGGKKYKNIHFFQFFKYLKHQQHQINAFPHKYEKRTHI